MGNLTASRGVRMILLLAIEMSDPAKDFGEEYPFWYIYDMLEGIKHDNIVVIAPIREFSRRDLSRDEFRVWYYPNSAANDIIVEYTFQELQKHNVNLCNP